MKRKYKRTNRIGLTSRRHNYSQATNQDTETSESWMEARTVSCRPNTSQPDSLRGSYTPSIPLPYINISNQDARLLTARGKLHLTQIDRFVNRGVK